WLIDGPQQGRQWQAPVEGKTGGGRAPEGLRFPLFRSRARQERSVPRITQTLEAERRRRPIPRLARLEPALQGVEYLGVEGEGTEQGAPPPWRPMRTTATPQHLVPFRHAGRVELTV